jgi:hypothetical protein
MRKQIQASPLIALLNWTVNAFFVFSGNVDLIVDRLKTLGHGRRSLIAHFVGLKKCFVETRAVVSSVFSALRTRSRAHACARDTRKACFA